MGRIGCYPGSFNPLTIAHLAIAEALVKAHDLTRVDLVVSTVALAKEHVVRPLLEHRLAVLEEAAANRPWLGAVSTDAQLLADIAKGYDSIVMGADKWAQVLDPAFYGDSEEQRDAAVARLPRIAVIPRPPDEVPDEYRLDVGDLDAISSTAVRAGRAEWMAPEAAAFDELTGAWTDPDRYEAWLR